jgi:hypothetical protein
MKVKTINQVINKKFDEWLASISDEAVRKLVEKNSILTGGAIASMLLREPVNDFDFYFKDKATAKAVAQYYLDEFKKNPPPSFGSGKPLKMWVEDADDRVRIIIKSAGIAGEESSDVPYEYFEGRPEEDGAEFVDKALDVRKDKDEKPDYRPVFLTDNAISLSGDVQLVIRFYGTPDQIHENYDFVHATNYWTSWDRKVTLRTDALECLLTKELRYIGSKYPICSLVRARKFIQRDWTINAGQFLKMSMQINELNLKDYDVLREQLVGMDVAYFMQVLSALKEKDPEKINAAYLTEVIDRIFG